MKNSLDVELQQALLASLSVELTKDKFAFKPSTGRFIRKRGEITDLFQLVWLDAKPGFRIQPNVGIRIEQIEQIFHKTSGFEPKYQKDTATMGNSVGVFLAGDSRSCEFALTEKSEALPAAESIMGVFRDFALPYFERWQSLAAIDSELNDRRGERTHHRALAWYRCSTGAIVAKLVGRTDYDQLASEYTEVMTRDNKGFYLQRFQALLKSLETIDSCGGLAKQ